MSTTVQNVNLYLPEFRKKKSWLDAEKFVLVLGAAVLLLVATSAVEYWQLAQLRSELALKRQEHQQVVADTTALVAQYGVQTEDPALLANIQELEEGLQSRQALLQFLEGRDLGNAEGFSEYLADLSRYHVPGLSLDEISLLDGGRIVEFGGQVAKADLVTIYVQNLGKGRTYAGMRFESLQIDDALSTAAADSETNTPANGPAVWDFKVRSLAMSEALQTQ